MTAYRSKLEEQWAAYFTKCRFDFSYEPLLFKIKDFRYRPDFVISHCLGVKFDALVVEVKGTVLSQRLFKIDAFAKQCPILVLSDWFSTYNIPSEVNWAREMFRRCNGDKIQPFSFKHINGADTACFPFPSLQKKCGFSCVQFIDDGNVDWNLFKQAIG